MENINWWSAFGTTIVGCTIYITGLIIDKIKKHE